MKKLQNTGLALFLFALGAFLSLPFSGEFTLSKSDFDTFLSSRDIKSELLISSFEKEIIGQKYSSSFALSSKIIKALNQANREHKREGQWDKVIWNKPHSFAFDIIKTSKGSVTEKAGFLWWLTFGLGIVGALFYILPEYVLSGPPGIKNNGIWHHKATNRGWIGWSVFVFLTVFYVLLYFFPDYIVNWVHLVDPISKYLNGNDASQWFLYGFLYCVVMTVMAVRMYIKYRNNNYQILRTTSVLFFQIVFAFLIPEILVRFERPWYDFKNAFPLDYDFFFSWNLKQLIEGGGFGLFILVWGIVLTVVIVPVMVYFLESDGTVPGYVAVEALQKP